MKLTSLQNQKVKQIVKMRSRSKRGDGESMLIEGLRPIELALTAGWDIRELLYCAPLFGDERGPAILAEAHRRGIVTNECSEPVFRKIAYRTRPEGVLAIGAGAGADLSEIELSDNPLLLIAEGVEKPGNLGALLRIADAVGADAVIVADGTTDINNPNVVRSSVGAIFGVSLAEASSEQVLSWLRQKNIPVLAATPSADQVYTDADLSGPTAIAVGAEKPGLTDFWLKAADLCVSIPMNGSVDSLNVATSAAIMLYETHRQRQLGVK